jgi:hypothetical protein
LRDGGFGREVRDALAQRRQSTGCGFPTLPVRSERERSVEDAGSPCRCDEYVTLIAEN